MKNNEKIDEILEVLDSKKNLPSKFENDLKDLRKTQLQLIIIAGATFSIFFASNKGPISYQTKYGLIFLVISILSGFISIIFDITNKFSNHLFDFIDIDTVINKNLNSEDKKSLGIKWGDPMLSNNFFENKDKIALYNYIRRILTERTIFLFQFTIFIQFLSFLIAIIFMLLVLLRIN